MMIRAVIYSRFSTDRQNESSIVDQVRVCEEHAQRQGWEIIERYTDQGISGAAIGNRPGVLKLQEAALARRLDVVLVTDLSRLSRSQGDLSKMIDRLVAKGVRIIGVQDGYDSSRRGHKLQAGLSGIIGEAFREMVKDRTYAALESRAKAKMATGGRAYGYRDGQVDKGEAFIVREIFGRFADGESFRTIAADLNARRIPSPGASWNRVERRADGWMGSGIRVIIRNERYRGVIHWNTSEWRKDPDSGKRKRVMRERSQWITHRDESLRVVSDELFERAQKRLRPAGGEKAARSGYRPKYLLSGLLRCDRCGAHYIGVNGHEYGCSSHRDGGACDNAIRLRRDHAEQALLGDLNAGMLAPSVVAQMVSEMRQGFAEYLRTREARAERAPKDLQDLDARIARLRERLRSGDPDMAPDEIQAAIERAEQKRAQLETQSPSGRAAAKLTALLPRAADRYRRQIAKGLAGDEREALKARVFLRDAFGGQIRLRPDKSGGLTAHWNQQSAALLKAVGSDGSGGRI